MLAMILDTPGSRLQMTDLHLPACGPNDIMLKFSVCGVCRTDLHILDGELPCPKLSLVPGHEIVCTVAIKGERVKNFTIGQRLGILWLSRTCGFCHYCTDGRENLCDQAGFTGYSLNEGYAEFAVADPHYCFSVPECYSDAEAAPLLCAGLIGYRVLVAAEDAKRVGIYGFRRCCPHHYPAGHLAGTDNLCLH